MKIRLSRVQVIRTQHLMHMRYAPSELAEELGLKPDTVYKSLIPAGCPHERDEGGRLWIVGTDFREWARAVTWGKRATADKSKMPDGYGYCFRCGKPVPMTGVTVTPTNPYAELLKGRCAECGGSVNRARRRQEGAGNGQP